LFPGTLIINKEEEMDGKDIQLQDKKEVESPGEMTREGVYFVPNVDIFEDEKQLVLLADMPGVDKDGVDINLEEGQLRIQGKVSENVPGDYVISEYSIGNYTRTFTISNVIDQEGIEASMKNGVLRVVLPKSDASKPRKIAVESE
jgi:HSP20 family protein